MTDKIAATRRLLREQGYKVESVMHEGKEWYQIDLRKAVASRYGAVT